MTIATPSCRQKVGNLSGGNQQKVLLAKWLALEPDLLIVDEPTRGVDVGARAEIYRLLRALKAKGLALLVVSSDLAEVLTLADRIVVMADGRIVERGAHRELIAADTLYRRMFGAAQVEGTTLDAAELPGGGGPAEPRRPAPADRRRARPTPRPGEVV